MSSYELCRFYDLEPVNFLMLHLIKKHQFNPLSFMLCGMMAFDYIINKSNKKTVVL